MSAAPQPAKPEPAARRSLAAHLQHVAPARLILLLVAVGLVWRVLRYALGFPFWGDESFVCVNFVARDYAGMIRPLVYGQIAPLVFMWVELAFSQVLGLSEWALHLFPTLCSLTALLLMWRLARRTLPRAAAVLAVGIFAVSFYVVRHGAEVKPYASDLLVGLGLTMLAWSVWQRPGSVGRWIALILLGAAAPWCSYPSVFVGGAVGLFLTGLAVRVRGRAGVLVGWALFGLCLGGSFLAMYLTYALPHAAAAARLTQIDMWALAFPPLNDPPKLLLWLGAIHTSEMFAYPHGGKPPGSIGTFLLFLIGCGAMWRTRRPLLVLLLLPFALTFVAACVKAYPYGGSARTSLYLAPAICLLAGLGGLTVLRWLLPPRHVRGALAIIAGLLTVFAVAVMAGDMAQPYQSKSSQLSKAAVVAVAQQTRPGDKWISFNADEASEFGPYLGDWRGVGGQFVFDALRFAPGPVDWAPDPNTVTRPAGGTLWLVTYRADHRPGAPKESAKRGVPPKAIDFPDEQYAAYLAVLTARLGPPTHTSYPIKSEQRADGTDKRESVEVDRFGP